MKECQLAEFLLFGCVQILQTPAKECCQSTWRSQRGVFSAQVEGISYILVSGLNTERKRRDIGVPEMPCSGLCGRRRGFFRLRCADWLP
jgi:hypothetical protein